MILDNDNTVERSVNDYMTTINDELLEKYGWTKIEVDHFFKDQQFYVWWINDTIFPGISLRIFCNTLGVYQLQDNYAHINRIIKSMFELDEILKNLKKNLT